MTVRPRLMMKHPFDVFARSARVGLPVVVASALLVPTAVHAQPAEAEEWWALLDSVSGGVHLIAVDSLYGFDAWDERTIGIQLTLGGPEIDGETFRGLHRSAYRYRYWTDRAEDQCTVREMAVLLRSVIRMPVLLNLDDVDEDLQDTWRRYERNLRTHEEGHRDITRRSLEEFRDAVLAAPPEPCETLRDRVLELRDAHSADREARQEDYDDDTGHGRTQGANWPPPNDSGGMPGREDR